MVVIIHASAERKMRVIWYLMTIGKGVSGVRGWCIKQTEEKRAVFCMNT